MTRRVIVVDTETTGLDPEWDFALEVAWKDYVTGEGEVFVPAHDREYVLKAADPTALEVNGYRERIMSRTQGRSSDVRRLHAALTGSTLVGSAPALDQAMLAELFDGCGLPKRPWHHRVVDLGSYAAGRLGLLLDAVPGLWVLATALGVDLPNHGAADDVTSTVAVLRRLEAMSWRERLAAAEVVQRTMAQ